MFELWERGGPPAAHSEAELLRALAMGDGAAMAALYRLHGGLICRFSLRMSHDESIAEEVTHEVFLALLKQKERFDPRRAALSTWLCGIARRLVWKHLERWQRIEHIDESSEIESPEDDPSVLYFRKEAVLAVQRGLDELPIDLRAVIILCEFEEMKYEDAADILAVPVGTVRSRLHRAKNRLARLLREDPVITRKENIP